MSSKVKIYTRTGDKGYTSLYGGKRAKKNSHRIRAYGTIDELNSVLSVAVSQLKNQKEIGEFLDKVQSDLFVIGTNLAGNKNNLDRLKIRVGQMESFIDFMDEKLPLLKNFIIPGGAKVSSLMHLARSVCRRAEREVVDLACRVEVDQRIIIYLNRLSDLLFTFARYINKQRGVKDKIWHL